MKDHKYIWAILAVALLLRVAAAVALGDEIRGLSGANDEITYSTLGARMAEGHGLTFPTGWYPWIKADRPQAYFSFAMSGGLGILYSITGNHPLAARLLMALAGTGVVGLIYLLGLRYFGRRVALVGAGVSAVYAYLIFYSASLVTETPFTLAVLASIYLAGSVALEPSVKNWAFLGLALMVAVHARMAIVFFIPLLLLWAFYKAKGARLVHAAIPLVMIGLSIAPFTWWNYQTWGHFVPLQTQFGHVFWNGNHPGHHGNFHPFKVFEIPEEVLALDNDAEITNRLLEMGIDNVRKNPGDFLSLTITRLREMFVFWPRESSSTAANILRVLSFGLVAPWALGGLILNLKRWRELLPILLFVVTHVGVHAVTWTMIRYRVPMDPFLILLAASALVRTQEVVFPRSVARAAA